MIGRAALRLVDRLGSIGLLLYQVASCMWSGQFRMRVLVEQIAKIGVQSQPVVIITGAFTGAVLEAQTLFQLQTVRMETMGGAVVAVGMFRELGASDPKWLRKSAPCKSRNRWMPLNP